MKSQGTVIFYAGTPLRKRDGQVLGCICVADDQPRLFAEPDRRQLPDLADTVADLIELRRIQQEAEATRRRYESLRNSPALDILELDDEGIIVDASGGLKGMTGYSRSELRGRHTRDSLDADSRDRASLDFQQARKDGVSESWGQLVDRAERKRDFEVT